MDAAHFICFSDMKTTVDKVLKLHHDLEVKYQQTQKVDLEKIFVEMKERFLIYAPFIQKSTNTWLYLEAHKGEETMNKV